MFNVYSLMCTAYSGSAVFQIEDEIFWEKSSRTFWKTRYGYRQKNNKQISINGHLYYKRET